MVPGGVARFLFGEGFWCNAYVFTHFVRLLAWLRRCLRSQGEILRLASLALLTLVPLRGPLALQRLSRLNNKTPVERESDPIDRWFSWEYSYFYGHVLTTPPPRSTGDFRVVLPPPVLVSFCGCEACGETAPARDSVDSADTLAGKYTCRWG